MTTFKVVHSRQAIIIIQCYICFIVDCENHVYTSFQYIEKVIILLYTEATHADALQTLKNTPPLVELVLLRSKDGNEGLLAKALKQNVKLRGRPASMFLPATNEDEREVMLVKATHSLDLNANEDEDKNTKAKKNQNDVISQRTQSFGGFSTFQKQNEEEIAELKKISVSKSKSLESRSDHVDEMETVEIVLEKTGGKGLGIGVTGGANTKIKDGMTVSSLLYLKGLY